MSSVCTGHADGQHGLTGQFHSQSIQSTRAAGGAKYGSSNAAVESVAKGPNKQAAHGAQEQRHMDSAIDQMVAVSMIVGLAGVLACGLVLLASSPSVKLWG